MPTTEDIAVRPDNATKRQSHVQKVEKEDDDDDSVILVDSEESEEEVSEVSRGSAKFVF